MGDLIEDIVFHPVGMVVLCFFVIVGCYQCSAEESRECQERGGEMVEDGTSTTWIFSNGMMYPITTTVHRCSVKAEKR